MLVWFFLLPVMCGEEERESFQLSFLPKELLLMESWMELMRESSSVRAKTNTSSFSLSLTHTHRGGLVHSWAWGGRRLNHKMLSSYCRISERIIDSKTGKHAEDLIDSHPSHIVSVPARWGSTRIIKTFLCRQIVAIKIWILNENNNLAHIMII